MAIRGPNRMRNYATLPRADSATDGFLAASDWNYFAGKQDAFDQSLNTWDTPTFYDLYISDYIYGGYFSGDGSSLSNLSPNNIQGFPGDSSYYLDGSGTWSVPAGGGGYNQDLNTYNNPDFGTLYLSGGIWTGPSAHGSFPNSSCAFGTSGDTKLVVYSTTSVGGGGAALAFWFPSVASSPYFELQMVPASSIEQNYMRINCAGSLTGSPVAMTEGWTLKGNSTVGYGQLANDSVHVCIYGDCGWRPSAETNARVQERVMAGAGQTVDIWQVTNSSAAKYVWIDKIGVFFPRQAATASAPTYTKGGIYFDTTLNKLRIGGATAWETVTST